MYIFAIYIKRSNLLSSSMMCIRVAPNLAVASIFALRPVLFSSLCKQVQFAATATKFCEAFWK